MSFPETTIFGNPPEATPAALDTSIGAALAPLGSNRRMWSLGPWPVRSIQLTTASPEARLSTSVRPAGLPPSTRIFLPNVFPESTDIIRFTWGLSPGAVNQTTATFFPLADTAGPLIGQPSISQPSLVKASGADHRPLRYRAIEMSRISLSERSRYAARRPSGVRAIDVLQHSHARLSICTSGPRLPFAEMVVYMRRSEEHTSELQ